MTAAEEAIRDAAVTLNAIEQRLVARAKAERDPSLDLWAAALRDTVRHLLSAVEAADPQSGPTTAQEGSETLSGQMSGVTCDEASIVRKLCAAWERDQRSIEAEYGHASGPVWVDVDDLTQTEAALLRAICEEQA